jgi:hypothetical protein
MLRACGKLLIDLDSGYPALLSDDFGQYRAVISSTATNMRHVVSGFEFKSVD